ncbi:hypothetical protein ARMGADRAFT_1028531 [Armillaria gallica]|uniref:Uncharacterized protein n=1 Tax=Armillaria gallica TaxID=47427 RepID=A0A2H3DM13_ARMGA|nr:hypothetical protein ARMGADRAFT_1028531 [Armillaria gallica]
MQQDGDDADDEYDEDALYEDFEFMPEILTGLDKVEREELAARLAITWFLFCAEASSHKRRLQELRKAAECPENQPFFSHIPATVVDGESDFEANNDKMRWLRRGKNRHPQVQRALAKVEPLPSIQYSRKKAAGEKWCTTTMGCATLWWLCPQNFYTFPISSSLISKISMMPDCHIPTERDEADADQHTACLKPDQLAIDDSHKVNKHIAKQDVVPIFSVLWTCMSSYYIHSQALMVTKSHEE